MKLLDKRTAGDLVKLLIFIVVTTLATGILVITIGNISFSGKHTYKAVFSDVTGVSKGDDVRVAGGALVEELHGVSSPSPSETVAPRTIGPTRSPPRSGTSAAVVPSPGASRAASRSDSSGEPA